MTQPIEQLVANFSLQDYVISTYESCLNMLQKYLLLGGMLSHFYSMLCRFFQEGYI